MQDVRARLLGGNTVSVVGVAGTTALFLLVAILRGSDLLICGRVHAARGFLKGLAAASHLKDVSIAVN